MRPTFHPVRTALLALSVLIAAPALALADSPYPPSYPPYPPAYAQQPYDVNLPALRAARQACVSDAMRLCPGVIPGGGRIILCRASQADQISEGCRTAIRAARAIWGQ